MGLYTNHCNLLDLCAVAVPENSRDFEMPFGITIFALAENEGIMLGTAEKFMALESVELAVCGLHLKGFSLEYQLKELGAEFVEHTETSENYRLKKLDTGARKTCPYKVRGRRLFHRCGYLFDTGG